MIYQSLETDRETRERVSAMLRQSQITVDEFAGDDEEFADLQDSFWNEVLLIEQRRKEDREIDREIQKIPRMSDREWARMWARVPYRRLDNRPKFMRRMDGWAPAAEPAAESTATTQWDHVCTGACGASHDPNHQDDQLCWKCGRVIYW